MSILFSHLSQGFIVCSAALAVIALLFAVFPKTAWTDAYSAAERVSESDEAAIYDSALDELNAPLIGVSDVTAVVGVPLSLTRLLTANGQALSSANGRFSATLNDCAWLGNDGGHPADATIGYSDGQVTFPEAGIYRLKVTVSDREGLKTTVHLYTHASRKGDL